MHSYKNLFLRQSYLDSYDDYEKSLTKENYPLWDYVILTASNEAQAAFYRMQIDMRLQNHRLPAATHYAVLPDPDGKRVGSGGATLAVLRYIARHRGSDDFSGLHILCIHSGGDSKRVPQYSVCGKLFSPVPRELKDGRRSTLFDEFIIGMTGVPARFAGGMLVCSGDVLLLFNPLQLDFHIQGAAALSIKEHVSTGKNHGVFLDDGSGCVKRFLHKQTVEALQEAGAVNDRGNVDIDTGAVIFGDSMLNDLYTLVADDHGFASFVNDHVRLSFYADFLYPLASDSTYEDYEKEQPEGDFSPELSACRAKIWSLLHRYRLYLLRFSPASFIHFGTTRELLALMTKHMPSYSFLDWSGNVKTNHKKDDFAASGSYVSPNATIGRGCYIEDCYIHKNSVVGRNTILSGITLNGETIPDNIVLHGLKLRDGRFVVRAYGIDDNPKEAKHYGAPISEPLWTHKCFIPCDTIEEALKKTLAREVGDEMLSLSESFNLADAAVIPLWLDKLDDRVKVESLLEAIEGGEPADHAAAIFKNGINTRVIEQLQKRADKLKLDNLTEFSKKIRIWHYLSKVVPEKDRELYSTRCFDTIGEAVLQATESAAVYRRDAKIAMDAHIVRLPIRVNFGGGWSDTAPYCIENGGTVLNVALKLNGNYPIEVELKKLSENKIILASADNHSYKEFTEITELQSCHNPSDPFALHKAALIACGVIPRTEKISIKEITDRLGGGLYLSTQVINIPRGSGLGTSSILSGACVKGLYEFLGIDFTMSDVYKCVMCMEQLMSTGGGWQDQVGGLSSGFKMLTTDAGLLQNIHVEKVYLSDKTVAELGRRFALIYTGQRRLARNLLREVMGKYIGGDPDAVSAITDIRRIAILMQIALEEGNVDAFARLMNEHWNYSKTLDRGCTNTCIDQIFNVIEDLIDGKMICGAGGGGFLQVIMKKNVTEADLKQRLHEVFGDTGVDVRTCEFDS